MERVTKRLLRSGGLFTGSVPVTPSMDANPNHLHDFTARSFRKLLADQGLVELDSLQHVQPYSPPAALTKTEERMQAMRLNIWEYYCRHPEKALLRFGSIEQVFNDRRSTATRLSAAGSPRLSYNQPPTFILATLLRCPNSRSGWSTPP